MKVKENMIKTEIIKLLLVLWVASSHGGWLGEEQSPGRRALAQTTVSPKLTFTAGSSKCDEISSYTHLTEPQCKQAAAVVAPFGHSYAGVINDSTKRKGCVATLRHTMTRTYMRLVVYFNTADVSTAKDSDGMMDSSLCGRHEVPRQNPSPTTPSCKLCNQKRNDGLQSLPIQCTTNCLTGSCTITKDSCDACATARCSKCKYGFEIGYDGQCERVITESYCAHPTKQLCEDNSGYCSWDTSSNIPTGGKCVKRPECYEINSKQLCNVNDGHCYWSKSACVQKQRCGWAVRSGSDGVIRVCPKGSLSKSSNALKFCAGPKCDWKRDDDRKLCCQVVPPNKPIYILTTSGKCEGDYKEIKNLFECEVAAKALKLKDTKAKINSVKPSASHPDSCYLEGDKLTINYSTRTTGSCTETNKCLCKLYKISSIETTTTLSPHVTTANTVTYVSSSSNLFVCLSFLFSFIFLL